MSRPSVPVRIISAEHALAVFAALWAAAVLFHLGSRNSFLSSSWHTGLSIAAVAVLWNPLQTWRLLLCAALQLVVLYLSLPFTSNHWVFAGFVNMALLAAAAFILFRRSDTQRTFSAKLWGAFAPPARICLLLLYFFVVLHKLNWDFLQPRTSCAVFLYKKLTLQYPFLPLGPWVNYATIWATIIVEALIPLLLVLPRYRMFGVLSSIALHLTLASGQQYYNFSSMMLAMLSLFVFDEAHRHSASKQLSAPVHMLGIVGLIASLAFGYWILQSLDHKEFRWLVRSIWIVFAVLVAGFLLTRRSFINSSSVGPSELLALRQRLVHAVPVLVFLNGICPYLGLKNENSFAMYSNLRTERRAFNHIFIPSWVQVFRYQDDIVEPKKSNHPRIRKYIRRHLLINFMTLQAIVGGRKKGMIVYLRDGQLYTVPDVSKDPILSRRLPAWKRKLLHFRPVTRHGKNYCHH